MEKVNFRIPKIIWGVPIAFLSLKFYLAAVFGYYFARFLAKKYASRIFALGNYYFHLHHWIMGLFGIAIVLIYSFPNLLEILALGFLGGLIFEGIFSYSDWYKIFYKKY